MHQQWHLDEQPHHRQPVPGIAQAPLVPATYTIPAGQWRINWYMPTAMICAGASVTLNISFNDGVARTEPGQMLSLGRNGQLGGTFIVYALDGTAINYATTLTSCAGAAYNLRLTAEQIQ